MLGSTDTGIVREGLQWLVVSAIVIYFIKFYVRRRKFVKLIDKIPGPKCLPFVGNLTQLGVFNATEKHFNKNEVTLQYRQGFFQIYNKCKIFRLWIGPVPFVLFCHPDAVEVLLSSNVLIDKGFSYKFVMPWIGSGLITSTGERWRKRRKQLTPAFHFRILQDFLPIINDNVKILVEKMQKLTDREWVDVIQPLTMCTLDVIGETAMGVSINSQNDNESQYLKSISEILTLFTGRANLPWMWPEFIFQRSENGKKFNKCLSHLHNFTRKVIQEKKIEHQSKRSGLKTSDVDVIGVKKRVAFLDLLMELHLDGNQITEEEMNEEVDTFMFAGHDTTAHALMWSLYSIGRHPHVQEKVHEELDRIFGEDRTKPATISDLSEMKYIDCVIKESLRLFPAVPALGRQLSDDLVVDGYVVPKGTNCILLPYEMHRKPDFFPNPECFDPDRFLPENCTSRHPYSYIPFSAGPRNCIGQKFAIMEEKVIIASLLRNFLIRSIDPLDKIHVIPETILKPAPHMRIKFTCR